MRNPRGLAISTDEGVLNGLVLAFGGAALLAAVFVVEAFRRARRPKAALRDRLWLGIVTHADDSPRVPLPSFSRFARPERYPKEPPSPSGDDCLG